MLSSLYYYIPQSEFSEMRKRCIEYSWLYMADKTTALRYINNRWLRAKTYKSQSTPLLQCSPSYCCVLQASTDRHGRVDGIGDIRRRCWAGAEARREDHVFQHLRDEPVLRLGRDLVAVVRFPCVSARCEGGTDVLTCP